MNKLIFKRKKLIAIIPMIILLCATFVYAEEAEETEAIDISTIEFGLDNYAFDYTGSPVEPELTAEGIEKDKDYTVVYENNIDPGTSEIIITGIGEYSGQVTLEFMILPYTPQNFKATLFGHDDVRLKWDEMPGASGYLVYYKRSSSSEYTFLGDVADCTYEVKDLKDHVYYDFKVIAYCTSEIGEELFLSPEEAYTKIMTKKYIKAPAKAKSILYGHDDVKITWSEVEGANGYYVYYKKASQSTYKYLGATTKRYYKKENLTDGAEYVFRVKPRYKVGEKYYSGYYGRNTTIYTLVKPKTDMERIGFTKVMFKWGNIEGETGYQVSRTTSRNKIYIVSTIKSKTAASKKMNAELYKGYYYRVRAYAVYNGERVYGPWSDRMLYKLNDQYYPKSVRLTKNNSPLDVRIEAGQKLYGYDIFQGSCTDGTYGYYILYNKSAEKCKIAKLRLSDNKVVKTSKVLEVHHGNDLTYNSKTNKVMAVHMTEKSKTIAVINPKTLKLEKNITVEIPTILPGATLKKMKKITGFNAIAYDSKSDSYVLRIRNLGDYLITDGDLNPVKYVTPKKKKHKKSVYAGLDIINGYIASAQYAGTSNGYSLVMLHDWSGKYIGTMNIRKTYELESVFNVNGKVYAAFYRSYYSNNKYMRSNYIYTFDF